MPPHRRLPLLRRAAAVLVAAASCSAQEAPRKLVLERGDRVVFVGNTFAERMRLFGNFETMLDLAYRELGLTFRNLGWSADTLDRKPRPQDFGTEDEHLRAQHADVIFACYGMNESFAGTAGLAAFTAALEDTLERLLSADYAKGRAREVTIGARRFPGIADERSGERTVRVALVSPLWHERLGGRLPDPAAHDRDLAAYTEAMRVSAARYGVVFVDLFAATRRWNDAHPGEHLTANGIHLTEYGDWVVARSMMESLGIPTREVAEGDAERAAALRAAIVDKNRLFFFRWRAVNGCYIYGSRKEPFGVQSFPPEEAELDALIGRAEAAIAVLRDGCTSGWSAVPAPRRAP